MHNPHRLYEFSRGSSLIDVSLRARGQGLQNGFIVSATPSHDDAQIRTRGLQTGHYIKEVLAGTSAQQHQINVLARTQFGQAARDQLQISLCIEQRLQPNKSQRIALDHRYSNRPLGGTGFHQRSFHDRGLQKEIVCKISLARSESIMNLSPCPFSSRVHVPLLERKVTALCGGVTCWFPSERLGPCTAQHGAFF